MIKSLKLLLILSINQIINAEYIFKYNKNIEFSKENNEYSGKNVIVFRHLDKETEGWGDIIITKSKNNISITSEYDYREAAKSVGYETYSTIVTSWRCQNQDYLYPEVPKVALGCGDIVIEDKYILYYKPSQMLNNPVFYFRASDREYGVHGNGSWVLKTNNIVNLNIGETKLSSLTVNNYGIGVANFVINENDWFMVSK